jgi:hypothetical protein
MLDSRSTISILNFMTNRECLARLISDVVLYDKRLMEHFRRPADSPRPEPLDEFINGLETKYQVKINEQ